jgi:4-amino-4-deoxy-L-arabinose transferase-like glycosyltransferase
MGRYFKPLIYSQLVVILFVGMLIVFNSWEFSGKTTIWSPIDEEAHFSYIQYIAQEHRIPILLKDVMQIEIISLAEKTYPKLSKSIPSNLGLAGLSYEAFQPPFYYMIASPFFFFGNSFVTKIYFIRFFNWLMLIYSLYILYRLIRLIFETNYIRPLAFTYNLFLFPSIIIRHITISNDVLAIPMALSCFYFIVKFDKCNKIMYLLIASILVSLAILTKLILGYLFLFFVLYLIYCFFYKQHEFHLINFILLFSIPVLFTLPWLYFNYLNYGGLTAHTLIKELMMGLLNPNRTDYGLSDFGKKIPALLSDTFAAHEVGKYYLSAFYLALTALMQSIVFFVPFIFLLFTFFSYRLPIYYSIPFFLNISGLIYITVFENFAIEARYLHGSLPLWYISAFLIYGKILTRLALEQLTLVLFISGCIYLMNCHLI